MKVENNLNTDEMGKLVLRLALPSMVGQFVNVLYSIVDRMYIGNIPKVGETALAGVGVASPIVTLIAAFAFLVGAGGAPIMSIKLGEGKEEDAKKVLANSFLLLLVLSFALIVIAFLVKNKLLVWFGASEHTYGYANSYLSIYLAGTVFALLSSGLNFFVIAQGFAKKAMISVLLGATINIVLDPIMIFAMDMGVEGAALATVIAQMASCLFTLSVLFGKEIPIGITFRGYDKRIMMRVLLIGLSPFLIVASDNIILIAMNATMQKYGGEQQGDMLLTCATIVQSFMMIIVMPLGGITSGTQTILGYNYGAKQTKRVLRAEKDILALGILFTGIMFVAAHTVAEPFVRLFTKNPMYISFSVGAIKAYTLAVVPLAIQYTVVDGLSGMGLAKYAISFSMFRKTLFLIGVFVIPALFGIEKIFYTEPCATIISSSFCAAFALLFLKKILHKRESEN